MQASKKVGAVLVVGGGIAGIQASLDLADSGFKVYLLEKSPSIGGVMAQLDKTFPTGDCSICILSPKLVNVGTHPNIELITNADLTEVSGKAGDFKVKILKKPRYVDEEKCTGCGDCVSACPYINLPDEFDMALRSRGNIFIPFLQAVPRVVMVDREHCVKCGNCVAVCDAGAIDLYQKPEEIEIHVGAIIVACGFDSFDPSGIKEYGYGRYKNVITALEYERLVCASGPTGGHLDRPSDKKTTNSIAFIQCVGSRDVKNNPYCSSVCCTYAVKEAIITKEHNPAIDVNIFYIDIRTHGKGFEEYYNRAKEEYGVRFTRCRPSSVEETDSEKMLIKYEDEDGKLIGEEFDLVVLSVGLMPPKEPKELSEKLGIELNQYGFCSTSEYSPVETSRQGIYVCGAFASPKDIPESVAQASGAASKASGLLSSERGTLVVGKSYPPEKDVLGEDPRIGVFICNCGVNIGGVVDIPRVVEYAKSLPNVAYVEEDPYTCSRDAQDRIKGAIEEHDLNRVVVASCTPRTHESLFRSTIREAGLNPYLFEMANIRDQCSWVHQHEKEEATEKTKDLVRMIVAKARLLEPLERIFVDVNPSGLVIGGGIAGMTAALELANQGYEVHLIEKEKELGGNLRRLYYSLGGVSPKEHVNELIDEVMKNSKIHVYTGTNIVDVGGYVGNFLVKINQDGDEKDLASGVIIIATGGVEYKPEEYLYGEDDRVLTQLELEEKLANNELKAKTIVMIQCVGSRNEERPYCSRVCCYDAIKNALKIKEKSPDANVYVLYRDIRTPGFTEDYYRKAREEGIIFLRYDEKEKPEVILEDGVLKVLVVDRTLGRKFLIKPDLLVLSAAVLPHPGNKELSEMLKVPLRGDGFFLEAHVKLRPIDFSNDGIFLCGLAHSPKSIDETLSQASAAASRAATILSKERVEAEGAVISVDEILCRGCGRCEEVCEYNALELKEIEPGRLVAQVKKVLCKGCGTCSVACPSGAITLKHFTDKQIIAMIDAMAGIF
ncbi:MAG: CoB--CoM heterodisulfide reductase iron-sulfur subunit A family protein [Methanocellales archaeon]|nr:CoB--CoM heterodisulfide reductase iron-sulfur subunit A family protein [Methanocellales archaeon]MDD3291469.1 CoB--CoM heterodisulfide reductase iron-sulfur subunit A family protein [Methanocellales archaeon]MDD5234641.1 CoB--CoM heterodisulfide reductase iron-sulfur subunit A family protein [Methanocellales archaeon]MDD5485006.1 CoB--CoM heterodisulfide reductase iron-sulfur subunit A family protein [Methanocellales archaeon]